MKQTEEDIKAEVRETPLMERLEKAISMIGGMCAELRPPKMSIPVRAIDEDVFITVTIRDAIEAIKRGGAAQ